MSSSRHRNPPVGRYVGAAGAGALAGAVLLAGIVTSSHASAALAAVNLGTTTPFGVLGASTVTNTGPSVLSGDLGLYPGTSITGFSSSTPPGPGIVINGITHATDAVAQQAQSDLTIAYNDAAGRTPSSATDYPLLGGKTFVAGVYNSASSMALTGTVTLDAENDPGAVFIFQAGSTLITATNSTVKLINGASACNVFWQVGSSATLDTSTVFRGSILALTSITANTTASVVGRLMARNGAVTLDTNRITRPDCGTPGPTGTPGTPGASGTPGTPGASGAPGTPGASGAPGTPGASGAPGTPGASGAPGTPGASGAPGTPGATGTPGPAGPTGAPGGGSGGGETVPSGHPHTGLGGASGPGAR